MRNKKLFTLALSVTIILLTYCKKNSEKAMEYNNIIADEMKYLTDIEQEIAVKDGPELDAAIEKFKKAVPESKTKIEKLGSFENDDSLQRAALEVCIFYQEVIDGKWSSKGQEAIQNKDADLDIQMQKIQSEFANKFRFEIKK
ncbi:MAG: hypothetical protein KBA66_23330 [Leptospiraceae bacterium]|nr:hypothetical protein [Leptospiraceae bacterium]